MRSSGAPRSKTDQCKQMETRDAESLEEERDRHPRGQGSQEDMQGIKIYP